MKASILNLLAVALLLYVLTAWLVFQWRNPTANEMSFFRDFTDVVTWRTPDRYQP